MKFEWSEYQKDIFTFVEKKSGNGIVEAVAGAAKTTTIIECYKRIPSDKKSIFLAFNKAIAEEMKAKEVNARTFHSLCFYPVTKTVNISKIDTKKNYNIVNDMFKDSRDFTIYASCVIRLVSLLKQSGVGIMLPNDEDTYESIMERYSIDLNYDDILESEQNIYNRKNLIKLTQKAFEMATDDKCRFGIDFDDLLYIAVKRNLNLGKFDFVFVDEAQDTASIQREILRMIMGPKSRLVAVGDPYQSIYGFRGADSESMNLIKKEFKCESLPLHISYRCPKNVVEFAKQYCSIIKCSDTAKEGIVKDLSKDWNLSIFQENDFILSRTNAPLVNLCYKLIVNKVPAKILGRDIAEALINLILKLSKKDSSMKIFEFNELLMKYFKKESDRMKKNNQDSLLSSLHDKCACIKTLIIDMNPNDDVQELIAIMNNMFSNESATITLSSIHKAKGLEAERVYWLDPKKFIKVKQNWEHQQENNMKYVASTRSKNELILLDIEKDEGNIYFDMFEDLKSA